MPPATRSPEHAGAVDYDVGVTSDLYSAGIVLFECLAGRPPFDGDTVGAVLLDAHDCPRPGAAGMRPGHPSSLGRADPAAAAQGSARPLSDRRGGVDRPGRDRGIAAQRCGRAELRRGIARSPPHAYRAGLRRSPERTGASGGTDSAGRRRPSTASSFWRPNQAAARRGSWRKSPCAALGQGMWVLRGRGLEMVGQRPFQVLHGIVEHVVAAAKVRSLLGRNLARSPGRSRRRGRRRVARAGPGLGLERVRRRGAGELRRDAKHSGPGRLPRRARRRSPTRP